ncbi:hypothetical protein GT204_13980 [Streptomyces sp. SID4919]|uniref:EF-hand domain-containing protein n=1 Tax=unclassified Streptomyces TaxID=2593676 RepID=UPI0008239CFE|nr:MULTISPECIES: hypothetical protein [unclassified Streptomyces]MYY08681.1 hypothetical protein [Streptomyces sp. SID4919]MYY09990.1 hypothetical protein [Streptomyces sp. SID4919]SCK55888.1 hypothetical protein YW7DRAFT_05190 [Streptomyces sp. AmelKG-E11A]SCK63322.1 hypothetical protein YW7DRAFT_07100 [Streptomyces sp. AmelKG-E11A]
MARGEYVAVVCLVGVCTGWLNVADGLGHVFFVVIDANGDYGIGREEFTRFLTDVWGLGEADALEVFGALDSDGDGRVFCPEFLRAIRGCFLLSGRDAPGCLFFGTSWPPGR